MRRRIVGVALMSLIGATPLTSTADTGRLRTVYARDPDGLQLIEIEGRGARPACAIATQMAFRDEKSDIGKAQYAMLMAAFLAGQTATVVGAGKCTRSDQSEDIAVVRYDR